MLVDSTRYPQVEATLSEVLYFGSYTEQDIGVDVLNTVATPNL